MAADAPIAVVGRWAWTDLIDVTDDPAALDGDGAWVVVAPYDDAPTFLRFATRRAAPTVLDRVDRWPGLPGARWTTTLEGDAYTSRVTAIREAIGRGDVYQVNLTRRLSTPVPPDVDVVALGAHLARTHPAPHEAIVSVPERGLRIASASPEMFLERDGAVVRSSPIKGTATTADGFLAKDRAENVMIVDLVRNDLGRVCEWGSVTVPALCAPETQPGLVHLVSTVEGRLATGLGWADLLAAAFPPGSVTGAPKVAAVSHIARLEPDRRGPYCGAIGWVDAEARTGSLNVAIRTFWVDDGHLRFGTGGGITWDSTPEGEWAETELKAAALTAAVTSGARSIRE